MWRLSSACLPASSHGIGWARNVWKWALGRPDHPGVVAAIISAPTSAIVFGGVTGAGTDLIVAAFARIRAQGSCRRPWARGSSLIRWTSWRQFLIVFLIVLALPLRLRVRFPNAEYLPK